MNNQNDITMFAFRRYNSFDMMVRRQRRGRGLSSFICLRLLNVKVGTDVIIPRESLRDARSPGLLGVSACGCPGASQLGTT